MTEEFTMASHSLRAGLLFRLRSGRALGAFRYESVYERASFRWEKWGPRVAWPAGRRRYFSQRRLDLSCGAGCGQGFGSHGAPQFVDYFDLRQGPAEVISLNLIALMCAKEGHLGLVFYSLRDDLQIQASP